MILVDAGPLLALVNPRQVALQRATRQLLLQRSANFATTLAVFTEATHLALRHGGWPMQRLLWQFWQVRTFTIVQLDDPALDRCRQLMERFADCQMDFADATLVQVAEQFGSRRIITFDSDFYIYRIHDQEAFDVINPSA